MIEPDDHGVEEILIVDDEEINHIDLSENDDFLIVQDPTGANAEDWCVLFVKGEYKNVVVKFDKIGYNTKSGELGYEYNILSTPEEDMEFVELDLVNYLTSALHSIMKDMHRSGGAGYIDLETKEEVTY
jgi:hypothetical protein